jgi:hypothetical protein
LERPAKWQLTDEFRRRGTVMDRESVNRAFETTLAKDALAAIFALLRLRNWNPEERHGFSD